MGKTGVMFSCEVLAAPKWPSQADSLRDFHIRRAPDPQKPKQHNLTTRNNTPSQVAGSWPVRGRFVAGFGCEVVLFLVVLFVLFRDVKRHETT